MSGRKRLNELLAEVQTRRKELRSKVDAAVTERERLEIRIRDFEAQRAHREELDGLGRKVFAADPHPVTAGELWSAVTMAVARLEALEHRILKAELRYLEDQDAAAQARSGWAGVWRAGATYRPGETVTHKGALWHCDRDTGERPGNSDAWTLMTKTR